VTLPLRIAAGEYGCRKPNIGAIVSRQHIIVGLDESVGAQIALQWAADECRIRGCTLLIVTVAGLGRLSAQSNGDQPTEGAADQLLTRGATAASLRQPGVPVTTLLRQGEPVETLIGVSRGAEMLVVGAPGKQTASPGSVRRQVAENARCPVAVIPRNWRVPETDGSSHIGIAGDLVNTAAAQFADDEAKARGIAIRTVSTEGGRSDFDHRTARQPDLVVLRRLGVTRSTTSSGARDSSPDSGWPCPTVYVDEVYGGHLPAADEEWARETVG
jgi:nucleotide-binding universal stress UspA family protein